MALKITRYLYLMIDMHFIIFTIQGRIVSSFPHKPRLANKILAIVAFTFSEKKASYWTMFLQKFVTYYQEKYQICN